MKMVFHIHLLVKYHLLILEVCDRNSAGIYHNALYTFLEEYDFSGKTIIPFTTHGGSGFSRTIQTISELQPNAAVISDGLSISRNSVPDAESEVIDWVNGLDLNN